MSEAGTCDKGRGVLGPVCVGPVNVTHGSYAVGGVAERKHGKLACGAGGTLQCGGPVKHIFGVCTTGRAVEQLLSVCPLCEHVVAEAALCGKMNGRPPAQPCLLLDHPFWSLPHRVLPHSACH